MTGPEHYERAEELLASSRVDTVPLAQAQIHATLALAAATAMRSGMSDLDFEAWDTVAGVQP